MQKNFQLKSVLFRGGINYVGIQLKHRIWSVHTTTYINSLFYSLPNNFKNHLYVQKKEMTLKNLNPVFPTRFCTRPCNARNITFPKTASICKWSNRKDKCNVKLHPSSTLIFFLYEVWILQILFWSLSHHRWIKFLLPQQLFPTKHPNISEMRNFLSEISKKKSLLEVLHTNLLNAWNKKCRCVSCKQ